MRRGSLRKSWRICGRWLASLTLLSLLLSCALGPGTGVSKPPAARLTAKDELALGQPAFLLSLQKNGGRYADSALSAYVDAIGQRLARQSQRPGFKFRFEVVNDSRPDAYALPGGFVSLTRGLLVDLSNETDLAAVLGHEIGHLTAGHVLQGLQPAALLDKTVGLQTYLAGGVAAGLLDVRYTSEEELEADRLAIDAMGKAGYDPLGAVQLQESFFRENERGTAQQWREGYLRRHPISAARRAEVTKYLDAHHAQKAGGRLDHGAFLRATERLTRTRPGYAIFDLASQLEKDGHLAEAIDLYHQALMLAPDEPLILSTLGLAYLRREDLVPARRYLLKAVNLQDDYYQSHLGLGYVYLQKQQYADAQVQLAAGFTLLPTLEGAYLLAEAREHTDDRGGARELYAAVARVDADGKLGRSAKERLKQLGP